MSFDAIAITNHNSIIEDQKIIAYAQEKDILLIPGMEATLSKKHVLIINPEFKSNPPDRSLEDLPKIKSAENLVIAPHPFFPQSKSLKSLFFDYVPYYDAIEYSHFYHKWLNYNKKAVKYARQYQLPLVGTSDCHFLWEFGKTYSLIEAEKNTGAIIAAVKAGKVEICSSPLSAWQMSRVIFKSMQMNVYRKRITP